MHIKIVQHGDTYMYYIYIYMYIVHVYRKFEPVVRLDRLTSARPIMDDIIYASRLWITGTEKL